MIRLKTLNAVGFKNLKLENLQFPEEGNILIMGRNESGKSTLFEVIYYILTDDLLVTSSTGYSDAVGYGKNVTKVDLEFQKNGIPAKIERTITLTGSGNTRTSARFWRHYKQAEEECIEGNKKKVNAAIAEFLGFDGEILTNSCFVKQKGIEGFIEDTKSNRKKIVDKLLNLDQLTEMKDNYDKKYKKLRKKYKAAAELVKLAQIEEDLEMFQEKQDHLQKYGQIGEALSQAQAEIRALQQKVTDLAKDATTVEGQNKEFEIAQKKQEKLKKTLETYQKTHQQMEKMQAQEKLLQTELNNFKEQLTELQNKKTQNVKQQAEYEQKEKETKTLQEDLKTLKQKLETYNSINTTITKINKKKQQLEKDQLILENLQKEINSNKKAQVKQQKDIVSRWKALLSKIENEISKLRSWHTNIQEKTKKLEGYKKNQKKFQEFTEKTKKLQKIGNRIQELQQQLKQKAQLHQKHQEQQQILQETKVKLEKVLGELDTKLKALTTEKQTLSAYENLEQDLQNFKQDFNLLTSLKAQTEKDEQHLNTQISQVNSVEAKQEQLKQFIEQRNLKKKIIDQQEIKTLTRFKTDLDRIPTTAAKLTKSVINILLGSAGGLLVLSIILGIIASPYLFILSGIAIAGGVGAFLARQGIILQEPNPAYRQFLTDIKNHLADSKQYYALKPKIEMITIRTPKPTIHAMIDEELQRLTKKSLDLPANEQVSQFQQQYYYHDSQDRNYALAQDVEKEEVKISYLQEQIGPKATTSAGNTITAQRSRIAQNKQTIAAKQTQLDQKHARLQEKMTELELPALKPAEMGEYLPQVREKITLLKKQIDDHANGIAQLREKKTKLETEQGHHQKALAEHPNNELPKAIQTFQKELDEKKAISEQLQKEVKEYPEQFADLEPGYFKTKIATTQDQRQGMKKSFQETATQITQHFHSVNKFRESDTAPQILEGNYDQIESIASDLDQLAQVMQEERKQMERCEQSANADTYLQIVKSKPGFKPPYTELTELVAQLQAKNAQLKQNQTNTLELKQTIQSLRAKIPEPFQTDFSQFQQAFETLKGAIGEKTGIFANNNQYLEKTDKAQLLQQQQEINKKITTKQQQIDAKTSEISTTQGDRTKLLEEIPQAYRNKEVVKQKLQKITQNLKIITEKLHGNSTKLNTKKEALIDEFNSWIDHSPIISRAAVLNETEGEAQLAKLDTWPALLDRIKSEYKDQIQEFTHNLTTDPQINSLINTNADGLTDITQLNKQLTNVRKKLDDKQSRLGERKNTATKNYEKAFKKVRTKREKTKIEKIAAASYDRKFKSFMDLRDQYHTYQRAVQILDEGSTYISQKIIPKTNENVTRILPVLTADRYKDGKIDDEYKIAVFDSKRHDYVDKVLFSGGTNDQIALAFRLAFAMATMKDDENYESFIILDEPLGFFDDQRRNALIDFLTYGEIAKKFAQRIVASNYLAIKPYFDYIIELENGRVINQTYTYAWKSSQIELEGDLAPHKDHLELEIDEILSEEGFYITMAKLRNTSNHTLKNVNLELGDARNLDIRPKYFNELAGEASVEIQFNYDEYVIDQGKVEIFVSFSVKNANTTAINHKQRIEFLPRKSA